MGRYPPGGRSVPEYQARPASYCPTHAETCQRLPPRLTLAPHVGVDLLSRLAVEALSDSTNAFSVSFRFHDKCFVVPAYDDELVTRLYPQLPSHPKRDYNLTLCADPDRPDHAHHPYHLSLHHTVLTMNFK